MAGNCWTVVTGLTDFARPDMPGAVWPVQGLLGGRRNRNSMSRYQLAQLSGRGVAVMILLAVVAPADARRLALVIGNDSYQHADALTNARADARAVADALRASAFQVTLKLDVTQQAMKEAIRTFKSGVAGGDEVIFYYAGHGVQLEGNNYMIPVDTAGENADQLKDDSVSLQRVLDDMQDQKARFTLAIVDACRDNPFKSNGRALRTRGLAPVMAADGQAVLYSAGAGQEALDNLGPRDKDPNGVFTRVLIREMKTPGLSFDQVIHDVRNQVVQLAKSVDHTQTPGYYSQFTGDFYFIPPGAVPAATTAMAANGSQRSGLDPKQIELAYWESIKDSRDVADFQGYLKKYPHGEFADLAANRSKVAPSPQPVPRAAQKPQATATPAPAAMPVTSTVPATVPGPARKQWGPRCNSILESAQLGESLNDEERAYVRENCH
jgi:Caspase domain